MNRSELVLIFLYLVHPKTAQFFTFQKATKGAASSVGALRSQIARVQREHPGAMQLINAASQRC